MSNPLPATHYPPRSCDVRNTVPVVGAFGFTRTLFAGIPTYT